VSPTALKTEKPITAREVGDYLGKSPKWVMEKCNRGEIPGYRLFGSNRAVFYLSEIVAALRERRA
jgi:predicted DNA-binding transcriptional regulator AlpA